MEDLQGSLNLLFFIILYVPINIFLMLVAAVLFNVINKGLRLNFPVWIVASAAALLVFVTMVAFLDSASHKNGAVSFTETPTFFYVATFIINVAVLLLMLLVSGIRKLIFRNSNPASFTFRKPQIIAVTVYAIITGFVAAMPLIREGNDHLTDVNNEAKLKKIKQTIDANDVAGLEKALEENYRLWELKLGGDTTVFEYLIAHDKPAMAHILLKNNKALFEYSFDWDVQSKEMIDQLIADGMHPMKAVEIAARDDNSELVKFTVEKYKPKFDTLVSFVTNDIIRHSDTALLDYLIANGLTENIDQTSGSISELVNVDSFATVKMLVAKGYKIDTAHVGMIYSAIYNNNLPMLKFLFQYPFDVNSHNDEYTNVENAIIGGHEEIFDYLLTLKPDIKTLHITKLNGETNALLIAERYKRTVMLEKLKKL